MVQRIQTLQQFQIWSGNGNRFLLYDLHQTDYPTIDEIVVQCNKHRVDGCLVVSQIAKNTIQMDYYDRDGTRNNCGNGMRVTATYAYLQNYVGRSGTLMTYDGEKSFSILDKYTAEIQLGHVTEKENVIFVAGVPHVVVREDETTEEDVKNLRWKFDANVNVVSFKDGRIYNKTYETGVENYTLSCGTGSVAVASVLNVGTVTTPGGTLSIRKDVQGYALSGTVERVA
jgi:diaminopimelate epimerase